MEWIISILPFLKYIIPEKSILVFSFQKTGKFGEHTLCIENKTKRNEVITRLEINGKEINENDGVLEKREFPIHLTSLSKLCWKIHLTKDNSNERPKIITVFMKGFWKTREKEYTL